MPETNKFAVIETGGKQYLVRPGSVVRIERISARGGSAISFPAGGGSAFGGGGEKPKKGDTVHFDKVLLLGGEAETKLGDPYIKNAKISGKLLKEGRYKKITHLRYHSKTRHAVKKGHRQIFSEVAMGDF